MEIIYSLLQKDFYISSDLISHFKSFPQEIYQFKDYIIFLENIDSQNINLKNIMTILYPDFEYKFNDTNKYYQESCKEFKFDLSNMFELLYLPNNYENELVNNINDVIKKFNIAIDLVDNTNYLEILYFEIKVFESQELKNILKERITKMLFCDNQQIFESIIRQYNHMISILDCKTKDDTKNAFEYYCYRLFIFFKVIGKDFITFINSPISSNDTITTILFKFNKEFFLRVRHELINYWYNKKNNIHFTLTNEEVYMMIFLLTYKDYHFSLIDKFCVDFSYNEEKYIGNSKMLHKIYYFYH